MSPNFYMDRSGLTDVVRHLRAHSEAFQPPLSSRVNLTDYSRKIVDHAARFEAWVGDELVGLVAVYCNSKNHDGAFVSNVSVFAGYSGRGIARRLMESAIAHVAELGFSCLHLKVYREAVIAMHLYSALGFQPAAEAEDGCISMKLSF